MMWKQKLYSTGLLIYCSFITAGNIQKVSDTSTKNAGTATMISYEPVFTLPEFDLNPTALQFAKEYITKNSWGLEKLKKKNRNSLGVISSVFKKNNIPT